MKPAMIKRIVAAAFVAAVISTSALAADPAEVAKGLNLVKGSDCMSCHRIPTKMVGPSFKEVADKYKGSDDAKVTDLAQKIIKGGSGAWGTIPMSAHPALTEADAKSMVIWVLSLAGEAAAPTAAATPAATTAPAVTN